MVAEEFEFQSEPLIRTPGWLLKPTRINKKLPVVIYLSDSGKDLLLDIDVQGAEQVRRKRPDALSIFLRLPSLEQYEERLRKRHTEDEAAIARRLATARDELNRAGEYDHQVMNVDLEKAVAEVRGLIARRFEKGTTCSTS